MRVAAKLPIADAKLTFTFPAWKEGAIEPSTYRLLVRRWDVKPSPEHVKEMALPEGYAIRAMLPDRKALFLTGFAKDRSSTEGAATEGTRSLFFDIETGAMRPGPTLAPSVDFAGAQVSPDGRTIAYGELRFDRKTGDLDGSFVLWDVAKSKEIARFEQTPPRSSSPLAFSADGRKLFCLERRRVGHGKEERDFVIWHLKDRKREHRPETIHASYVPSPNRQFLAAVTFQYTDSSTTTKITLQDMESGKVLSEFPPVEGSYVSPIFSPDGKLLVSAGQNRTVLVWDVGGKRVLWKLLHEETEEARGVAVSPDSKLLTVSLGGAGNAHKVPGTIAVWNLETGERLTTLHGHTGPAGAGRFLGDRRLISNGFNEKLRFWNLATLDSAR